jgi:hypothetical protein
MNGWRSFFNPLTASGDIFEERLGEGLRWRKGRQCFESGLEANWRSFAVGA